MSGYQFDEVSRVIVDSAYNLHTRLGPGLLESAYESLLFRPLQRRGLVVERQKLIWFEVDGIRIDDGLRLDLLVEGNVVVEIKSVEKLQPVHAKQLLTYLRVLDMRIGLLINFGGATLKEGLRRIVNGYIPGERPHVEQVSRLR